MTTASPSAKPQPTPRPKNARLEHALLQTVNLTLHNFRT